MELTHLQQELVTFIQSDSFIRATISQPRLKSSALKRIRVKPIELKNEHFIQFEYQYERIIEHDNIPVSELLSVIEEFSETFRQWHIETTEEIIHVQLSKKFKVLWKSTAQPTEKTVDRSHNRKKNYLLDEHTIHPFLVRLGVQTPEGHIRKQHFDKFKQINRFIEFIDDALIHLPTDRTIRILDFGSGKSYLTFALYHYLHIEKGLNLRVTGLDLKKEVIEECQQIANDLQYEQLEFLVGDINDYNDEHQVDMVVTLHACDTATDLALARAVRWNAAVILSVPCCQHELFNQIQSPILDVLLQHGLMKERFSALATDAIRAQLLDLVGYETQLVEFIDLEHTPKNVLIRSYRTNKQPTAQQIKNYQQFTSLLHAQPYLEKELIDRLPFCLNNGE